MKLDFKFCLSNNFTSLLIPAELYCFLNALIDERDFQNNVSSVQILTALSRECPESRLQIDKHVVFVYKDLQNIKTHNIIVVLESTNTILKIVPFVLIVLIFKTKYIIEEHDSTVF